MKVQDGPKWSKGFQRTTINDKLFQCVVTARGVLNANGKLTQNMHVAGCQMTCHQSHSGTTKGNALGGFYLGQTTRQEQSTSTRAFLLEPIVHASRTNMYMEPMEVYHDM